MNGGWVDRFGTVAASACALHCALLSFMPALLPVLGLSFLRDERLEWGFVACAIAFASAAAWRGHTIHRAWSISAGFALGGSSLLGARGLEMAGIEGGVWLAVLGGAVLVSAHILNLTRCRSCAAGTCE